MKEDPLLNPVSLTLAISDYDHVRDLTTGRVPVEGIQLTCLDFSIEEIFYRFTLHREWDISEMSMAKYVSLMSQGDKTLTAIPVFPSRVFRHSSIYVRKDGPVRTPADLAGRRVGLPEWAQTAAVYTRGMLAHQYGVGLAAIDWIQAGTNQPGRVEKVALKLPPGVKVIPAPEDNLSDLLVSGGVDAVMAAHPPTCFENGHPNVRRLFEDFIPVEEAFYRETGIFPIMHVVALKQEVLDRHPWVAMNLFKAFEEAKRRCVDRMSDGSAPRAPIPWLPEQLRRAQGIFGKDHWPYGIDPNRRTLEAFLRYAFEQGVCHRHLTPEDLFPANLKGSFRV
jgi:4,5-dihydroxyphthalate decarboxylase